MAEVPSPPHISEPAIDPKTGLWNPVWYAFFEQQQIYLASLPAAPATPPSTAE